MCTELPFASYCALHTTGILSQNISNVYLNSHQKKLFPSYTYLTTINMSKSSRDSLSADKSMLLKIYTYIKIQLSLDDGLYILFYISRIFRLLAPIGLKLYTRITEKLIILYSENDLFFSVFYG